MHHEADPLNNLTTVGRKDFLCHSFEQRGWCLLKLLFRLATVLWREMKELKKKKN